MPAMSSPAAIRRVTVIGHGAVGSMFANLFREDLLDVTSFDHQPAPGVYVADACHPSTQLIDAISSSDIVLLALPEHPMVGALQALAMHAPPHALVVETASIKSLLEPVKQAHWAGREILGINPMFAPSLGIQGQTVVICRQNPADACARFEQWLQGKGAKPVAMDAGRHDQMTANAQALVHAAILSFADALYRGGMALDDLLTIAPPPFKVMAALAARILGQNPETYWDIQAGNPYAEAARLRLRQGLARCGSDSACADAKPFALWLEELGAHFGDRQQGLQDLCAHLFSSLSTHK